VCSTRSGLSALDQRGLHDRPQGDAAWLHDRDTLVGMCSTILNGAKIGRNCLIGAKTLITEGKVIPDNSLVMGVPGRVVRQIDEAGICDLTEGAALYFRRWHRYQREFAATEGTSR
jgi:carbonic anhydrase/acetyltransferase-like protein (isoleucine patch superfamily)